MGPHRQTVFDQLDLEIIDQVYAAAWAQLLARDPAHDATEEGERQKSLRRRLFAFAHPGAVDFDMLCDRVLTSYRSQKVSPLVSNPRDPH